MKAKLICLLLALTAGAFAQQDPFDFHVASLILLQDKSVQGEVEITKAQRERMNVFADAHRAELKKYEDQLNAAKTQSGPDKTKLEDMFLNLKKKVFAELRPDQLKRLREISLQSLGFAALNDEIVAKRVGMSDDQLKRVRKAFELGFDEAAGVERQALANALAPYEKVTPKSKAEEDKIKKEAGQKADAARKKASPRVEAIRTFTKNKIMGILTQPQRAAWQALQGKSFRPKG